MWGPESSGQEVRGAKARPLIVLPREPGPTCPFLGLGVVPHQPAAPGTTAAHARRYVIPQRPCGSIRHDLNRRPTSSRFRPSLRRVLEQRLDRLLHPGGQTTANSAEPTYVILCESPLEVRHGP